PVQGVIRAGVQASDSGFQMRVQVRDFAIDPPAARGEEGEEFASEVSDAAREGTRENLLGEDVLDAQRFPEIVLQSVRMRGPRWTPDVIARITLHGQSRDVTFPAAVFETGD